MEPYTQYWSDIFHLQNLVVAQVWIQTCLKVCRPSSFCYIQLLFCSHASDTISLCVLKPLYSEIITCSCTRLSRIQCLFGRTMFSTGNLFPGHRPEPPPPPTLKVETDSLFEISTYVWKRRNHQSSQWGDLYKHVVNINVAASHFPREFQRDKVNTRGKHVQILMILYCAIHLRRYLVLYQQHR